MSATLIIKSIGELATVASHQGLVKGKKMRELLRIKDACIVIEGENASRFTALLNALRDELQPQSGIEDGLVEDLATCRWRQRRLLSMETACLTGEIRRQDPEAAAHSNAARAVIALSSLSSGTRALDLNKHDRANVAVAFAA